MSPPPRQLISCFDTLVFAVDVLTHADGTARAGAATTLARCRAAGKRVAVVAAESESSRAALHARLARAGLVPPDAVGEVHCAATAARAWAEARAQDGTVGVVHVVGGEPLRAAVRGVEGLGELAVPATFAAAAAAASLSSDASLIAQTLPPVASLAEARARPPAARAPRALLSPFGS